MVPFSRSSARGEGLFLGPDLRIGNAFYLTTNQSYTNIVPAVDVGWMFVLGRAILNARIVQSICVATLPSDSLVAPACAWCFSPIPSLSPVLPVLSFDVGFSF